MCACACLRVLWVCDAPQEAAALRETLAQLQRHHAELKTETVAKDAEIVQLKQLNQAMRDAADSTGTSPGTESEAADSPPFDPDLGAGDGEHPQVAELAARASQGAQPTPLVPRVGVACSRRAVPFRARLTSIARCGPVMRRRLRPRASAMLRSRRLQA